MRRALLARDAIDSKIVYAVIFALSAAIFVYYVALNVHAVIYDEAGYWTLAQGLRINGIAAFADPLRSYLYPAIIAVLTTVTGENVVATKLVLSIVQYLLYAFTVWLCADTAGRLGKSALARMTVLFLGLVNPYLVSASTLMLTDVASACLATIALIYVTTRDLDDARNAAVVAFCVAAATMVRPSAAVFVATVGVLAAYRIVTEKQRARKLIAAAAASLVVFLPQLYINVSKFGDLNPLIHTKLYGMQTVFAVSILKYGTVAIAGQDARLIYHSPFPPEAAGTTIFDVLITHPFEFAVMYGAHLFGLLDWAYVNTYIYDLSVGPRLLPSIYLYAQWFLIALGIAAALRAAKRAFFVSGALFSAALYALFMGTTTVESRFGFPLYLFLLPFAG
ncbi:MAG TPA: hypothetical protein VGN14_18205, partial [Candidatus Elarobacter sp.]